MSPALAIVDDDGRWNVCLEDGCAGSLDDMVEDLWDVCAKEKSAGSNAETGGVSEAC